jgi:hypothetical protein
MKDIRVNDFVAEGTGEMVIVTGIPRSGTSIVGKVLGSLCDVEYAFEPPLVPYLDAQVRWGRVDPGGRVNILNTYIYYKYFVDYHHGRRYHFRPSDDCFVLSLKPFNEIVYKWEQMVVPKMPSARPRSYRLFFQIT